MSCPLAAPPHLTSPPSRRRADLAAIGATGDRERCPAATPRHSTPRRPGTSVVVLSLLGAFHCLLGQAVILGNCPHQFWQVRDGSGPCHCWPQNVTTCCGHAQLQATQACLEYEQLGFGPAECAAWPRAARNACHRYCGDCVKIADAIEDICRFSLQMLNNGPLSVKYCGETRQQFLNYRCPIGCHFNASNCTSEQGNPEGDMCMSMCGNYAKCNCRKQRGTFRPDKCDGPMVLKGPKTPNSTTNWTCSETPRMCANNIEEGRTCNKYRLCPTDMCLVKRVSCPPLDQCTSQGFCSKAEGLCYYNNVPDGTVCNDEIDYTVNDVCINGFCKGEANMCLKYNVTCPSYSPCMGAGLCHPSSGRCSYSATQDGYPCDDGRSFTVEDRCQNGFCLGRNVDLCREQGVDCSTKIINECYKPGTCDPKSGQCSLPIPLSNRTCDDADYTTVNDTCIDGMCIGYATVDWANQKFETLGEGQCADRNGRQMPSYSGDVMDELACEKLCRGDRQCNAFSYSPPVCTVYGTIRTQPPEDGRNWSWQIGSLPKAVVVEEATKVAGQRESVCRKKDEFGDKVLDQTQGKLEVNYVFAPMMLAIFFAVMMLIFCIGPILRCFRTCCCGIRKDHLQAETKVVQSPGEAWPALGDDPNATMDLRGTANGASPMALGDQPGSGAASPAGTMSLPHAIADSPEQAGPSQALAALTLPPATGGGVLPGDATPSETNSSPDSKKGKGWSRPVGRKKAWNPSENEVQPPPSGFEKVGRGPNIAPTSVANSANVGLGLM